MAQKVRCETCARNFKNQTSLEQHNSVKHLVVQEKVGVNKKKVKNLLVYLIVLVIVALFFIWFIKGYFNESLECKTLDVNMINIGSHENLNLHKHVKLKIIIDGVGQAIPAYIGVYPGI